jgi:Ni/Fe-hydrogenase 1 B-type cytochrome subunit
MVTPARQLVYVWEIPVRVTHWTVALCILMLSITGYYIGSPFFGGGPASQPMLWARALHHVFAVLLTCTVIYRIVWAFIGNQFSRWSAFVPFATPGWWKRAWGTMLFYGFMQRKAPPETGHNPLAATAYLGIYVLLLVQIVTGSALSEPGFSHSLFGWVAVLMPLNDVRLVHHLVMWLLLGFVVHHIYSSILMDNEERSGIISSIFTGYKAIRRE